MLFGIPNDLGKLVSPCEPWNYVSTQPAFGSKPEWLVWRGRPDTEHLLFTPAEGLNPALRCDAKTNPIRRLHALVADYDSLITPAMDEAVLQNAPSDLRPNWISHTFSGGRRLVYLFEEPLVFDPVIAKKFLSVALVQLRLRKLLPGLDTDRAWPNITQIYDVGSAWTRISDKPLPSSVLHLWLTEAAKNANWKTDDALIPIEAVAAEVERQYPASWPGEFALGARGNVFWDGGQNPTSTIVAENGMICFSREKIFYSWAEVLGAAFVRKFTADKIGGAVSSTWWDGRSYFCKDDVQWWTHTTETVRRALMVDHGLDAGKQRTDTCSEVDRALRFIEKHRRVAGAVPFVYNPADIVHLNGQKFLNTSHVKPLPPADEPQEWAENFPWLAAFFQARLLPNEWPYLLAWVQRVYSGALAGNPLRCQALFLVGGHSLGKTLFSNKIMGGAMGGFADASSHIAKGSEFNRELGETGLLCVDDAEVASDPVSHRRWSEAIKKIVANPVFTWRAMRRDPQTIPLNGKIIVTLNDDMYSLQMIPDLAVSMVEKVLILKFHDGPFQFQSNHIQETIIQSELPFFLRYTLDWAPPAEVLGEPRFGVTPYINDDLRSKSLHAGGVGELLEIVAMYMKSRPPEDGDWVGTASDFYAKATLYDGTKSLLSKYTPRVIGRRFSEAARIRDSGITLVDEDKKRGNRYRIVASEREPGVVRVRLEIEEVAA